MKLHLTTLLNYLELTLQLEYKENQHVTIILTFCYMITFSGLSQIQN